MCQVFSSTVPARGKNWKKFPIFFEFFSEIFLVSGKSYSAEKCKRESFGSFWTSIFLQIREKMKGDPLETFKKFAKKA